MGAFANTIEKARRDIRSAADPKAAPGRKKYLKSPFTVLGCALPDLRRAAKAVRRAQPEPSVPDLLSALENCWDSDVHEDRLLAILIAESYRDRFDHTHVAKLFRAWIADSANWDFVDGITTYIVGWIALAHPKAWTEIEKWATDDWMWLRRASLLAHIPAIRTGALREAQLRRAIDRLIDEKDFFIRKAIGWTLRELAKTDPSRCETLIRAFWSRASGLTRREALRQLPPARQKAILKDLA